MPASLLTLSERLPATAALILSARYDVLAWNGLAEVLLEDFGALEASGLGGLEFMCDVLVVPQDDQHVVLLSAASDTSTASRLRDVRAEERISRE